MGHFMASAASEAARVELERRNAQREGLADLLSETAAFVRNHPEIEIVAPWDTDSGSLWEVRVAGMSTGYDDPQFMMTALCERFGFTED
jgi:hypothetical protein